MQGKTLISDLDNLGQLNDGGVPDQQPKQQQFMNPNPGEVMDLQQAFQSPMLPPRQLLESEPARPEPTFRPQREAVSPTPLEPAPPVVDTSVEESEIGEKRNPTFSFMGYDLDVDSTVVLLGTCFIWIMIWFYTGLYHKFNHHWIYFFIFTVFILYMLINILTSGNTSGGVVYELNILLTVEQMISILFGTIIVFLLFIGRLPIHEKARQLIYSTLVMIAILLTFASLWLNVITSGRSFRAIRKAKQGIYNISLSLFIVVCIIAFQSSTGKEELYRILEMQQS